LSLGEFNRLQDALVKNGLQLSSLVDGSADLGVLARTPGLGIEEGRLRQLLGRGFQLSQAVERWAARSIWVTARNGAGFPLRLNTRLKEKTPPLIYGCGAIELLDKGGLAVVGSRDASEDLLEYARNAGRLTATARRTLVSGGARGIDRAAMAGALENDGAALGVLADSLDRASTQRDNRDAILAGRLTLVSPYDPLAGFHAGNAMQRNKLIYALADAALVVNSDLDSGGTWAGAVEELEKFRNIPVYVRSAEVPVPGLDGLKKKGALEWSQPSSPQELERVLTRQQSTRPKERYVQREMLFG